MVDAGEMEDMLAPLDKRLRHLEITGGFVQGLGFVLNACPPSLWPPIIACLWCACPLAPLALAPHNRLPLVCLPPCPPCLPSSLPSCPSWPSCRLAFLA